MTTPVEKVFLGLTTWLDDDIALAQAGDLGECVGKDGEVDVDKVAALANDLVVSKPYLRRAKGSPDPALPHGPTGAPVGSGRKHYGPHLADEASLRKKYPALNA